MIKKYNKISYKNKGSAIITALVVSTVVMVLCLSLLAVAYSLFLSQKESTSDMSDRELLYSAIELMEEELTSATWHEESGTSDGTSDFGIAILDDIYNGFTTDSINTEYMIQNSDDVWLYYDPDASTTDPHHDLENCSRYFNIRSIGSVKIVVQMYWMLPELSATGGRWDGKAENCEGTVLHAIYRLYNNDMEVKVKAERAYKLMGTKTDSLSGITGGGGATAGDYVIVFATKNNVATANSSTPAYLPDPIYFDEDAFDDVSLIPDIVEKVIVEKEEDIWYKWYTDSKCLNEYDKNNLTKSMFTDVNGQKTLTLYTNWGSGAPRRVNFMVENYLIKKLDVPSNGTIPASYKPDYSIAPTPENSTMFIDWMLWTQGSHFQIFFPNDQSIGVNNNSNVYAVFDSHYKPYYTSTSKPNPGIYNQIKQREIVDMTSTAGLSTTDVKYDFSWVRLQDYVG